MSANYCFRSAACAAQTVSWASEPATPAAASTLRPAQTAQKNLLLGFQSCPSEAFLVNVFGIVRAEQAMPRDTQFARKH